MVASVMGLAGPRGDGVSDVHRPPKPFPLGSSLLTCGRECLIICGLIISAS